LLAVEIYQHLVHSVGLQWPPARDFQRLLDEHQLALNQLCHRILADDESEPLFAGSQAWAQTGRQVYGSGTLAALEALKQGEVHGIREYETALGDESLDATSKELIGASLLPRQRSHLALIDRLILLE
jgi:hypothetical protein